MKLSAVDGGELWRADSGHGSLRNFTVALDANGDVIAGDGQNPQKGAIVKLSGIDGTQLWRVSPGSSEIAVDANGDVLASSFNDGLSVVTKDVRKISGADGTELWRTFLGTSSSFNFNSPVTIDATGHIVAAASIFSPNGDLDITVVKLAAADGEELWRVAMNGSSNGSDAPGGVAVDSQGNVVVTGETRNVNTQADFTVVKISGTDGAELWRTTHLNPNVGEGANGVAVDAHGDVVAVGAIANVDSGLDFAVVKLRGTDGSLFGPPAVLEVSPSVTTAGGTVTATWSAIASPTATDWIGLFATGTEDTAWLEWMYVSCTQTPDSARATGDCALVLPATLDAGAVRAPPVRRQQLQASGDQSVVRGVDYPLRGQPDRQARGSPGDRDLERDPHADGHRLDRSLCPRGGGYRFPALGLCQLPAGPGPRAAGRRLLRSCCRPRWNLGRYELRLFADNSFVLIATSNPFTAVGQSR